MSTETHTITTLNETRDRILSVAGVTGANVWEKGGKRRIYVELDKKNGGKTWNGGRACTAWFDADANALISRRDWAGAKTRNHARSVLHDVAETLGVEYQEVE